MDLEQWYCEVTLSLNAKLIMIMGQIRKPVPVIIPYFRDPEALEKCVAAIKRQKNIETIIFVRDNSDDNILYTKAINEGLRKFAYSDAYDYVLVLTQDAFLASDALEKLVACLEQNQSFGIASPIQVSGGTQVTWAGSLEAFPWGQHDLHLKSQTDPYPTYWANGACQLLRTTMVREIGLLDDGMVFICSDCDYSFTARSRGWEVAVVPDAICEHTLGASAKSTNLSLNEVKLADQLYFASKWLNGDLYRSLSKESAHLTRLKVRDEVDKSVSLITKIGNKLTAEKSFRFPHKIFSLRERAIKKA